jgi:predicted enzyme related to lactoylglutathione lyase
VFERIAFAERQDGIAMTAEDRPLYRTGKICYIEMPAADVARSAEFYRRVFGWRIRQRGDGSTSFDDTVGGVSGTWVLDRPPAADPRVLVYIMVADAEAAVDAVVSAGGEIVRPIDPAAAELFAWFRDPGGNVLGLYQQPGLAEAEKPVSE